MQVRQLSDCGVVNGEGLGCDVNPLLEGQVVGDLVAHVAARESRIWRCSVIVEVTRPAKSRSPAGTLESVSAASSSTLTPRAFATASRRARTSGVSSTMSDIGASVTPRWLIDLGVHNDGTLATQVRSADLDAVGGPPIGGSRA